MTEMSAAKYRVVSILATVFAIVVGGGGYFAFRMFVGSPLGGPCNDQSDCQGFSPICLSDDTGTYCSVHCDGPQDCPVGYACGGAIDEFTRLPSSGCARAIGAIPGMPTMPGMTPMPMMPGMTPMPVATAFPK
jgi:hypothetical protein